MLVSEPVYSSSAVLRVPSVRLTYDNSKYLVEDYYYPHLIQYYPIRI